MTIILKNITAQELSVSGEELTERFVRGDASRNTEGSGLGLAIAKSFTEIQGGKVPDRTGRRFIQGGADLESKARERELRQFRGQSDDRRQRKTTTTIIKSIALTILK
ncbi:MAG: hypothetical protein ACLR6I_18155 [Waltera sp.]